MKNLKMILTMVALLVAPFISKAQKTPGGYGPSGTTLPSLTIKYVDYGGNSALNCQPKTNTNTVYSATIAHNTSYTFGGFSTTNPFGPTSWSYLSFSAGGRSVSNVDVQLLESYPNGTVTSYD